MTPLYSQKLALTSPTGDGRSVGIVRSRTKATECVCVCVCVSFNISTINIFCVEMPFDMHLAFVYERIVGLISISVNLVSLLSEKVSLNSWYLNYLSSYVFLIPW